MIDLAVIRTSFKKNPQIFTEQETSTLFWLHQRRSNDNLK